MQFRDVLKISLLLLAMICLTIGCDQAGDDQGDDQGKDNGGASAPEKPGDDDEGKDSDEDMDDEGEGEEGEGEEGDTDDDGASSQDSSSDAQVADATADDADANELVSADAPSEDRGNLIIQFVYDGMAPTPEKIVAEGADADYCNDDGLVREDLVVDPKTKGIANVVGWLTVERGEDPPAAPPGNEEAKKEPVVLDNIGCRFEPHMVLVQTGQKLIVRNSDQIGHNAKANLLKNADKAFSDNLPAGKENDYVFDNAESLPMIVECTAHPWMRARLFILDHPYFAKSDKTGKLVIKDLPVGEVTIRFNHELAGNLRGISVDGQETDRRGEVTLTIKPGDNDMGVVKLEPSTFE